MLNAVRMVFSGSFQFRIATNPDFPTPGPYCHNLFAPPGVAGGNGWTFAYGETPFDAKVRLNTPVALRRAGLVDTWVNTTVVYMLSEAADAKVTKATDDPLLGQKVSYGPDARLWDPRNDPTDPIGNPAQEELRNFKLSIGGGAVGLTADPAATPTLTGNPGLYRPWATSYATRKLMAMRGGVAPPERQQCLNNDGMRGNYATFFSMYGKFLNIGLTKVAVTGAAGIAAQLAKPDEFDWTLNLFFCRFDGDTLTGRTIGDLFVVRKKTTVTAIRHYMNQEAETMVTAYAGDDTSDD